MYLNKNIDALKKTNPLLEKKIKDFLVAHTAPIEWSWLETTTKDLIPVFNKKQLIHSKYNPQKESLRITETIPQEKTFTIFLGFGAGYTIEAFLERKKTHPQEKCLVIETNFCLFIETLKKRDIIKILSDSNIKILVQPSEEELKTELLTFYNPMFDGGLFCVEQRSLVDIFIDDYSAIKKTIEKTIMTIKADYSTQAHFGKIWTKNIISNAFLFLRNQDKIITAIKNISTTQKRKHCVVLAAGPSLNMQLRELKKLFITKNLRDEFCIIATDTAYSVAIQENIIPDFFVSIDAQIFSVEHIINSVSRNTTIISVFSSNSNLLDLCIKKDLNIFFFKTKHPLEQYIFSDTNISELETGTGTVTISALSFADFLQYKSIILLGADFAYNYAKPYSQGTYLSFQTEKKSNRLENSETFFSSIMFRTPTKKFISDNKHWNYVTETLTAYKNGTDKFLATKKINTETLDYIKENISIKKEDCIIKNKFTNNDIEKIKTKLTSLENLSKLQFQTKNAILSPLLAWCTKNDLDFSKNPELSFEKSVKITEKIYRGLSKNTTTAFQKDFIFLLK